MARTEKLIDEWVRENLISHEVGDAILAYESRKPSGSWVLSGFLILGAVTVGIGIISLVAANWNMIPSGIKLAADLLLLIGLAFGVFQMYVANKPVYFEMFLVGFQIACLASIGLISQIYNTGGDVYQALLVWSVITIGVAVAARKSFSPFLWAGGFFTAIFLAGIDSPWLAPVFKENYLSLILAVCLLSGLLAMISRKCLGEVGQTRAIRFLSMAGVLTSLVAAEIIGINIHRISAIDFTAFLPAYVLATLLGIAIAMNSQYNRLQTWISLLALILFLSLFHFQYLGIESEVVYAVSTLTILIFLALLMASLGGRKVFQALVFMTGLRFLVLYFQALGGLATTGIGLIISGGLIIGMVVLWNKKRQAIANWAEGLLT